MQEIKAKVPHTYDKWNAVRKCSLYYKGSSPALGKVSAENVFKQLVTKHTLHYTSFYGDGNSEVFPVMGNAYGPEKPVKSMNILVTTKKGLGHIFERKKDI